jgi:hypothetical protein
MEAACSWETTVPIYNFTWYHNPEGPEFGKGIGIIIPCPMATP